MISANAANHRRFPRPGKQSILGRMSWSVVGEFDPPLAEPGDWSGFAVESRLTENRVVAPAVEADGEAVGLDRHDPGGLDEPTIELLRIGLLESAEPRRQPAVAAVGDHGQRG